MHNSEITKITNELLNSYQMIGGINHVDDGFHPSRKSIEYILDQIIELLFPGFFERSVVDRATIKEVTEKKIADVSQLLSQEIFKTFCWLCEKSPDCTEKEDCKNKADDITNSFFQSLTELRKCLKEDVDATYLGDPAAVSAAEIILAYPGFLAITIYRLAHYLHLQEVPLIPRLMTEIAHGKTGIDIHPGATIGKRFCIDHGTGVVIGETSEIGDNVKLYQGVTIGALSIPNRDAKGKRHPTLKDNVTVYARTTILGGETIIGENSIIGGNTWITSSIPPNSKIYFKNEN
ncbi:serine O-acetyltransferase EpsC [Candidatus Margulisiibacteriota bacterium]